MCCFLRCNSTAWILSYLFTQLIRKSWETALKYSLLQCQFAVMWLPWRLSPFLLLIRPTLYLTVTFYICFGIYFWDTTFRLPISWKHRTMEKFLITVKAGKCERHIWNLSPRISLSRIRASLLTRVRWAFWLLTKWRISRLTYQQQPFEDVKTV